MKSLPPYVYAIGALGIFALYRRHVVTAGGAVTAPADPYGIGSATEFSGSGTAPPNGYYADPNMTTPWNPPGSPAPVSSIPAPVSSPVSGTPIYVRPVSGPQPIYLDPIESGNPEHAVSPIVSPTIAGTFGGTRTTPVATTPIIYTK